MIMYKWVTKCKHKTWGFQCDGMQCLLWQSVSMEHIWNIFVPIIRDWQSYTIRYEKYIYYSGTMNNSYNLLNHLIFLHKIVLYYCAVKRGANTENFATIILPYIFYTISPGHFSCCLHLYSKLFEIHVRLWEPHTFISSNIQE